MPTPTLTRAAIAALLLVPLVTAQDAPQDAPQDPAPEPSTPKFLTLEQASGRAKAPSFAARAESISWAPDGIHVQIGGGKEVRWLDPETLQEVPAPAQPEGAEGEPPTAEDTGRARRPRPGAPASPPLSDADRERVAKALQALEGVDEKLAEKLARRRGRTSADGAVRLIDGDAGLYFHGVDDQDDERVGIVPAEEGPFRLLDLTADGSVAGWVAHHDLHLVSTVTGDLIEVTDDGSDEFFNGELDWVYQEEVYGRGNFKSFWFSPAGGHVAFLTLDESPVHEFTVVDHVQDDTFRVKPETVNWPKAGDPNPTVALGIARTSDGQVTRVDLGAYEGIEFLIVRVGWTPAGRCLFMVQDRIQTWCDVSVADPDTGAVETLFRENSETWVDRPSEPRWLADGTFLWESARTGYDHLYHYRADGTLIRPVTAGDWALTGVTAVDEEAGTVTFRATEGGAVNVNHYRVNLDGSGFQRLTRGPGSHSITFRADGRFLLDRVSSLAHPEEVRLCDATGDLLKVIDRGEIPAQAEGYPVARWELFEVPARDGQLLDVSVLKPVPFDPQQRYPVWVSTYSGPNAPSVRNRWNSNARYQFLAQNGVIVLQANVRSASGKGHWSTGTAYKQMGVVELRDLEDAVDWLTANPWADGSRVGITGYSYGGFMTAYAMLASDRFALGIAGGGVYDWGMYDTIYTERYMSTPQLNPEGYAVTSCLKRAGDLKGYLHMHHGVMDDNVHFQNMMQLALALQKAGKTSWSVMPYPQNRHGISNRDQRWHSRLVEWELIQEHLRPVTAVQRAQAEAEVLFEEAVGGPADARRRSR